MYTVDSIIDYLKREIRYDKIQLLKCKFNFTKWNLKGRIEANKEVLAKLENMKDRGE